MPAAALLSCMGVGARHPKQQSNVASRIGRGLVWLIPVGKVLASTMVLVSQTVETAGAASNNEAVLDSNPAGTTINVVNCVGQLRGVEDRQEVSGLHLLPTAALLYNSGIFWHVRLPLTILIHQCKYWCNYQSD